MKTIRFHFYAGRNLASLLIRARLSSKFSHVGIEVNDRFFDATMMGGSDWRKSKGKADDVVEIQVTDKRNEEVFKMLNGMAGSRYDFRALLGFMLGIKIQNSKNEFCSEVGRMVFEAGTGKKMRHYTLMSPSDLRYLVTGWKLAKEPSANKL